MCSKSNLSESVHRDSRKFGRHRGHGWQSGLWQRQKLHEDWSEEDVNTYEEEGLWREGTN